MSEICPYRKEGVCPDYTDLLNVGESDPRFEDLREQDFELCTGASPYKCLLHEELTFQLTGSFGQAKTNELEAKV